MLLKGYKIGKKICESNSSIVYKAVRKKDDEPVILKFLQEEYPTPAQLTRYQQEYEIIKNFQGQGIIQVYGLEKYKNSLVLIFEDFGGISLTEILKEYQFNIPEFLKIAIKIVESLGEIHAANIIHKDINPSNIVYCWEKQELKIIDFGISTILSQENLGFCPVERLEGTLPYISPEQTGRMNRSIDYRSDFYSLGVTFYQILSKKLPFQATSPMDLIHCHLAKNPIPPYFFIKDSSGVKTVSDIIMKLMEKTPEKRYQNAKGLKIDLQLCLDQIESEGKIKEFSLGNHDISEKFQISQNLYGREIQVKELRDAVKRITQGNRELILVSGYSGIGKSVLVNEVHKDITEEHGFFISGKFDQLKRDIPYGAIIQAFQELIKQLLSESEANLAIWKNKLQDALSNNTQVIIEVIPELELIIGEQPDIPKLNSNESQNRFNLYFQKFIKVFTNKEHPLFIFLDDLQWADGDSLKLIELIISDNELEYCLTICAYRDNEVNSIHPVMLMLNNLEKKVGHRLLKIQLEPLNINCVNKLIADTLNCSLGNSLALAELLFEKTNGNPFFLTQLLQYLYNNQLISFNHNSSTWQWDIDKINKVGITDNVVDLTIKKIEKLDEKIQNILKLAACIGNRFDLKILAIVNGKSLSTTAKELWEAVKERFILPLNENYKIPLFKEKDITSVTDNHLRSFDDFPHKFLHDRIQEAAYSLISDDLQKEIHLQVGRLLLENQILNNQRGEGLEDKVFEIVNHFNKGKELIVCFSEIITLVGLNLTAGKKAKSSTAYELAVKYFQTGLDLLPSDSWKNLYSLTLDLHIETIEVLFLNVQFEEAQNLSEIVFKKAKTILDKVKVYELQLQSYHAQLQLQLVIDTARKVLTELGVDLPQKETPEALQKEIDKLQQEIELSLNQKSIDSLINLPEMKEDYKLAAIRILLNISTDAMILGPQLFSLVTLTGINLCLKNGNSPHAAGVYTFYGMFLCGLKKDIESGYKFGQLSLKLLDKFEKQVQDFKTLVLHHCYAFVRPWQESIKDPEIVEGLQKGVQIGLETGDLENASYCGIGYCLCLTFSGYPLDQLISEYQKYKSFIVKYQQEYAALYINLFEQFIFSLSNPNKENYYLIAGETQEEEDRLIHNSLATNNQWFLFTIYLNKIALAYINNDYQKAYDWGKNSQEYTLSCASYLVTVPFYFYYSLTLLALCFEDNQLDKQQLLEIVFLNQEYMAKWAKYSPKNYQHKYYLIQAEIARFQQEELTAMDYYDRAITGASQQEFRQDEAIAYERAAQFYYSINRKKIGEYYLKNARHCYSLWGAIVKVKQLELKYGQFLVRSTNPNLLNTIPSTHGDQKEGLDLNTVIKASQAITEEIVLEKLLSKLMKILIENAGAQKAFLILPSQIDLPDTQEINWNIEAEAEAKVDGNHVKILESIPLDRIDPITRKKLVSEGIVHYVMHTQKEVVLNDATKAGQFIKDDYIISVKPLSVMCFPLVDGGKIKGIIYLENNLMPQAFTPDRVKLLEIVSSQAAISIENSRLYSELKQLNQQLDAKIKERTKELEQTVKILKQTQEKLVFENLSLKESENNQVKFEYKVGGSLPKNAATYVVRFADRYFYQALQRGDYCYILNSRQMGKSSLMVRMMGILQQEGWHCATIDLTQMGSDSVNLEQWYKGMASELRRSFKLMPPVKFKKWWSERLDISPLQRLTELVEEILTITKTADLENDTTPKPIAIFLDEIDTVLSLEFPVGDFFALVRSFYNQRSINPDYQRLTFSFFGVATPSELITDPRKTPFNIGQAIELSGFGVHEAQPLLGGLKEKVDNPQVLLQEIIYWTNGQPFLTQKICSILYNSSFDIPINQESQWIKNLIYDKIIDNWEFQDDPQHLKTIRDRLLRGGRNPINLLQLYEKILLGKETQVTDSLDERELLLSGLVVKQQYTLKVNNPIYQSIFNQDWIKETIAKLLSEIDN